MKTILYTGARSGIASKVIDRFINNNDYFICVTVRTEMQLKEVLKKYNNIKNIECFKLDVTDENDLEKIKNLDIDILISNAAIGYGGSVATIDINKMEENFDVNVFSNVKLIQIVLKNMIKKDNGKIILMSSLAGMIPIPFLGSYCATKSSITKLAQCLKKELKLISNIKVILIEPGLYHTGFNQVMFENKYDNFSYFKEELELIKAREDILLKLFEQKNFDDIVNKIYKAIVSNNPKFIYRSPFYQVFVAKLYQLFFE